MEQVYRRYEDESYKRITLLIQNLDDTIIPRKMFVDFMDRIYKRNK